jgi:hypothetical protein
MEDPPPPRSIYIISGTMISLGQIGASSPFFSLLFKEKSKRNILIIKPTRCTISQIYFWNRTLHVSDIFSVHHQEAGTVETAIGICHTADCLLVSSQQNLYDIYLLLCVQCYTPDNGQRNCPKHVEFYSKIKYEKLVHLVGFITRIYHDARSSDCQIQKKLGKTCFEM